MTTPNEKQAFDHNPVVGRALEDSKPCADGVHHEVTLEIYIGQVIEDNQKIRALLTEIIRIRGEWKAHGGLAQSEVSDADPFVAMREIDRLLTQAGIEP